MAMISNNDSFWYLMLADFVPTILLIGFFYYYNQAKKSGGSILAFTDSKNKSF